jgi:GNAT superfamily N-acetyltransferase
MDGRFRSCEERYAMKEPLTIRPARDEDQSFIIGLAGRFADFDTPPWRPRQAIEQGVVRWLSHALDHPSDEVLFLVAERPNAERVGFIFLHEQQDFFTATPYAHVSEIAVTPEAVGTGAAEALMEAGAEWARQRGYFRMGLNVFEGNSRARRFYERLGYRPETLSYVRMLTD